MTKADLQFFLIMWLAPIAVMYLSFSFWQWSFSPGPWGNHVRLGAGVIAFVWSCATAATANSIHKGEGKKS